MADTQPTPTKVIRATAESDAGLEISNTGAALVGHKNNFVIADDRGITLKGNISIVADSHNIRRGGMFVGLSDFAHMIPSTAFTPVPQHIPFPPITGIVGITTDVAFFLSLLI